MTGHILLGREKQILAISEDTWKRHLAQVPQHSHDRLAFMAERHHRVRYFAVSELARLGKPVTPPHISASLKLPLGEVNSILLELEEHLFFLARNEEGAVIWAYPMTVEPTPHRLSFSSGEKLYAA
jgi:hypothetical protein